IAAGGSRPLAGAIFVTVNDSDKPTVLPIVRRFHEMGFRIVATDGTARYLRARGVPAERVAKVHEGRPNAIDLIVSGEAQLLINTPLGKFTQADDYAIRRAALMHRLPYTTTMSAAKGAKVGTKPAAATTPPPAKVKFRGRVLENEPLARYTTYRLGGPARYFVMPADADDVAKALDLAQDRGLPWLALGLGSNLLVKDAGFPGVVIRLGKGLDRFEMKGATAIV